MMVGYGIAAWPFLAAKYGLHQRWRVLTALIGVAALLAAALLASSGARAATAVRPSDARSGSLILKTEGEGYIDAARLGIDVDVTVSGPTLRARVTQVFRNTTNDWVEAIYVYPLPDGGAVDTLKMVIGDRIVVGDIKERQQARVIYEQAKRNGQKAALTEQERPNIFTNAVANIGPGETVLVQIEYQENPAAVGISDRRSPWADTWPEARNTVKRIGASAIALAGSSGQALAFGPGHVERTADAGERGVAIYPAHRDTHFRFLKDVAIGDEIDITRHDGKTFRYRADGSSIVRYDQSGIDPFTAGYELVLTTCWPFDAIAHGPMRYALHATMISPSMPAGPSSPL